MKTDYAIIHKNWNGIEIEIRWIADYVSFDDGQSMAHLEVESVKPARAPLPITETGYRSHFINRSNVDHMGGPEAYVEAWIDEMSHNRTKRLALVDGIKYRRIGDDAYYCQELFEQEELKTYLKNAIPAQKSVFEYVVYDSEGTEKTFAEDLEANEAVKVYAKLPAWFKVPTPLGTYNPDWAVLIDQDGEEKLYFVVETKSSGWWDDLRHHEGAKIKCGEKHFQAIAVEPNPARFIKATSVDGVMKHA